ncbi:MAG: hypothetical protein ACFCUJ_04055 [Thiotrichales bacterium]
MSALSPTADSNSRGLPDFSMNHQFLSSCGTGPGLRIGVVVPGLKLPRFVRQALEDIAASGYAKVVCVVCAGGAAWVPGYSWRRWVYSLYLATLDRRRRRMPDPLEPVAFDDLVPEARWFELGVEYQHARESIEVELRALDLDVVLRLGTTRSTPEIDARPRHGVWAYTFGEDSTRAEEPLMLREVLERRATTVVRLQSAAPDRGEVTVLCEARFSTSTTLSISANRYAPLWGSSHFVIQQLCALHEGHAYTRGARKTYTLSATDARCGSPGNVEMLGLLARRVGGSLRRALGRLPAWLRQGPASLQWRIALRSGASPLRPADPRRGLDAFRWLDSPPGHFWADPFLFEHAGTTWLFFEDYDYALDRALIACGRIDPDGVLREVRPVLQRPYHVSYPQVFAHAGEIYMVPETAQAGGVDLYRARRFPGDWVLVRRLLDVRVVDATLAWHEGRWWMFASPMAVTGHAPLTYVWSAEDLLGEWRLCSTEPVCADVTRSRGAGAIIERDGHWYRPSQDCASGYGRALWFNEVLRWDDGGYAERPVARLNGDSAPELVGVHTYNHSGNWEAIDGQFRWPLRRFR